MSERKLCKKEVDYCYNSVNDITQQTGAVIGAAIVHAMIQPNTSVQPPDTNIVDTLVSFMTVQGKNANNMTLLSPHCLLVGASAAFVSQFNAAFSFNKEETQTNKDKITDEKVRPLIEKRLSEIQDKDELAAFLKVCVSDYTDASGKFKIVKFAYNCPVFKQELAKTYRKIPYNINNARQRWTLSSIDRAIDVRNYYIGHVMPVDKQNYTLNKFEDAVSAMEKSAAYFDVPELSVEQGILKKVIGRSRENLSHPCIPFDTLQIEIGQNFIDDIDRHFSDFEIDWSDKCVCFHTLDDIKQRYALDERILAEAQERYLTAEGKIEQIKGIVADSASVPNKPAANAVPRKPVQPQQQPTQVTRPTSTLSTLVGYAGGGLNKAQIDEIFTKSVVLADAAFWLNAENRRFIAYALIPYLQHMNRVLAVDWSTRVELYAMETDKSGKYTLEQRTEAHMAHNQIHELHQRKLIKYGTATPKCASSHSNLMHILQANNTKWVTILNGTDTFCDVLINNNINNVIPLFVKDRVLSIGPALAFPDTIKSRQAKEAADEKAKLLENWMYSEDAEFEEEDSAEQAEDTYVPAQNQGSETPRFRAPVRTQYSQYSQSRTQTVSQNTSANTSQQQFVQQQRQVQQPTPQPRQPQQSTQPQRQTSGPAVSMPRAPVQTRNPAPRPVPAGTCIQEDNRLLTVRVEPTVGSVLYTSDGRTVRIGNLLGKGGEGNVYLTQDQKIVAKLYNNEHRTVNRRDKLTLMLDHNPRISQVCWPTALLSDSDGVFVGFLMPAVPGGFIEFGKSVLKLNSNRVREQDMRGWDRSTLVQLCLDICNVFNALQRNGIIMGDVNPRNMMLAPHQVQHPDFRIVDCDSFQIGAYPCPVGTLPYTSPEIYKRVGSDRPNFGTFLRTREDEQYSIACLLFSLLMLNQSPFTGKGTTDMVTAMRTYQFAYRYKKGDAVVNAGENTPDGPYRLIWNNLHAGVKRLFVRVFTGEGTVAVGEWTNALNDYKLDMNNGLLTKDLLPNRYYDTPDRKYTIDFVCELCGMQTNMPKERYENNKQHYVPNLCNSCMTQRRRLMNQDADPIQCTQCGKNFVTDRFNATLISRGMRTQICDDCRNKRREIGQKKRTTITCTCSKCGSQIEMSQFEFEKLQQSGKQPICSRCLEKVSLVCTKCGKTFTKVRFRIDDRPPICGECLEKIPVTCSRCGRQFMQPRFKVVEIQNKGHRPLCDNCRSQRRR